MKHLLVILVGWFLTACAVSPKVQTSSAKNFTQSQYDLIMAADSAQPMRVFKINQKTDSLLLRQPSERIEVLKNDQVLKRLTDRMLSTVTDSLSMGVGIAAPQVGILKQVILVQRLDKEGFPFEQYINPVIRDYSSRKRPCREGCLSIPDRRDTTTTRSFKIIVEYDRLDGSHHKESVEDFVSVIFQHEIDHLNGILYIDHLNQEMSESE